jgi:CMD domain protein
MLPSAGCVVQQRFIVYFVVASFVVVSVVTLPVSSTFGNLSLHWYDRALQGNSPVASIMALVQIPSAGAERNALMSEAKANTGPVVGDAASDLLNALAGVAKGSRLATLRAQRAEIMALIQANYDALFVPADDGGVTHAERGLVALRVALLDESKPLVAHYRDYVARYQVEMAQIDAVQKPALDAPLSPRLIALLAHADRLTDAPHLATPEHLAHLKRHGLSDANIVTISQLIAFVSFQVRALVGLQLLAEEE